MAKSYPMKIRTELRGSVADVKVLIEHPMETGLRKDKKSGKLIPAHFIQNVVAQYNGKTVLDAQWSQAISRDPLLGFRVNQAKAGDKVVVRWTDNEGMGGSIETSVE